MSARAKVASAARRPGRSFTVAVLRPGSWPQARLATANEERYQPAASTIFPVRLTHAWDLLELVTVRSGSSRSGLNQPCAGQLRCWARIPSGMRVVAPVLRSALVRERLVETYIVLFNTVARRATNDQIVRIA